MTAVLPAATIPDFDAEQFAYLHGALLSFRFNIKTRTIDHCKGYNGSDAVCSLNDLCCYSPQTRADIIAFLDAHSHVKSKTKIMFSVYVERNCCNIIHNLYYDAATPDYWHFHLNFIEQSPEVYLQLAFVSVWHETSNDYVLKSTYNNLSRSKELHNSEYEVLKLWTQGYSSKEIAEILRYSVYTINDYKQRLYEKFRAISIYQLIRNARKEGFI